ncbi:unnamed protein product [Hyaloperonospora brassicae]|uniref:GPI transamidase component PIG-T n=1 Tax=Hyaloperonospora brassicae TaxID=162125 RepID=A0AAV0TUS2_HYABA|nr:unnamed protein product [Hyaloperonospora brassicae]CAI5727747.1 unnamed protein product [Hyaloperonospora brassicae]CAI5728806.1 unnamed protein product [Hyaloperonospora brassicae]
MRRWATALRGLAVSSLFLEGDSSSSDHTLALWPQEIDAALSLSLHPNGSSIVKASHGGGLFTYDAKVDVQSEIPLDPLLESIEIMWIPATDVQSSTFDRFWVHSIRLDGMSAVGIRLQTTLRAGNSWSSITAEHTERVEENIRGVLRAVLPSVEILPGLSKGFLAKSLCSFWSWKTRNPLQETLNGSGTDSPILCYTSSFPLSLHNEGSAYPGKAIREASGSLVDSLTSVEVALLKIHQVKQSINAEEHSPRSTAIKLSRSSGSPATIEAEVFEVWISPLSKANEPWKTALPACGTEIGILVVTSIDRASDLDRLTCDWICTRGERDTSGVVRSVVEMQVPKTAVAASLQTAIKGKGFHRQHVIDVKLLENSSCGANAVNKTILVRVSISSTAYVDLDEIRRMARFGDLELLSFAKHIDIERPSPISSQHVVGLTFTMPSTGHVHIDFPLHFRYQAPSENELYRRAFVIAPDVYMFCPEGDRSVKRELKPSKTDATHNYLHTWGLLGLPDSAIANHYWLHLSTKLPRPVAEVSIPVGYLPSDWLVSSVTLLFASIGAALLCYVSVGASARAQGHVASKWKGKTD